MQLSVSHTQEVLYCSHTNTQSQTDTTHLTASLMCLAESQQPELTYALSAGVFCFTRWPQAASFSDLKEMCSFFTKKLIGNVRALESCCFSPGSSSSSQAKCSRDEGLMWQKTAPRLGMFCVLMRLYFSTDYVCFYGFKCIYASIVTYLKVMFY